MFFKHVHIILWWDDIDPFVNGEIFILGIITDIQNPVRESMHICNSNADS